ncbi:MAG: ribonuclease HII [Anaerolineales bacterium]|nr:ribonuclease HII [Anaerolineales bacterium]
MPEKFDRDLIPSAPDLRFELELWQAGVRVVAGIDEAGRGALAGPVSAAALILPPEPGLRQILWGVRDSKQLTPARRAFWAGHLRRLALGWGVGFASNYEIDEHGIVPATRLAVQRALDALPFVPGHLLVDYLDLPDCPIPQTSLVKGDARCLSIAGASILAKTARDEVLRQLDAQYPGYGFAGHKGYGTLAHRQALARLGPSPAHRRSFRVKVSEKAG